MTRSVLITGCLGGIGASLVSAFNAEGWRVVGVDRAAPENQAAKNCAVIRADIGDFVRSRDALKKFAEDVRKACGDSPLSALINNAAVQHVGGLDALQTDDILESLNVNIAAPMLLAKAFHEDLKKSKGSIINIGSVHAQATKPGFAAYATSKAALHGLTRALAVDFGPDIRVNTLAPAATATPMLLDGFKQNPDALKALNDVHPMQRIAEPGEIAKIAVFLASDAAGFLTGATFYADGGVLSRLHDPA